MPQRTTTPTSPAPAAAVAQVAVIGNPNTGKSTLFCGLTHARSRVANYPGATIEKVEARVCWDQRSLNLIDLPGAYSLAPRSLDEMVAVEVLTGQQPDIGELDAVVCVADASNLERNLYLLSQLLELRIPVVLVLNMWDAAEQRGMQIDRDSLAAQLGVAVVAAKAHQRVGLEDVRHAIIETLDREAPPKPHALPQELLEQCGAIVEWFGEQNLEAPPDYIVQRLILDVDGYVQRRFAHIDGLRDRLSQVRERLERDGLEIPVCESDARYAWARGVMQKSVACTKDRTENLTDRLDAVLTHRFAGLLVFVAVMFLLFQTIFRFSEPLTWVMQTVQGWISDGVVMIMPPGALRSLLTDGVIEGVGGVLTFLPQIALLFLCIAVLEDCGYMARAAYMMDTLMTKVGLSGKSFVPLMSSFACAVPGVLSTRVIEDRRDRLATILVAPLMSCSARLPVYLLMIRTFLPAETYLGGWLSLHGIVLLAMMSLGAVIAAPIAWLLKATILRGPTPAFVMELPEYKVPSWRIVLHRVYDRSRAFVVRAGTLIFAATILVWAAGYFPGDRGELLQLQAEREGWRQTDAERDRPADDAAQLALENQLRSQALEQSFLGRAGKFIEPAVKPLGWDWRIGVGVIASFPAREVIIAAMGAIYSMGGDVDEEDEGLQQALRKAKWPDGRPVFTIATALSIMVFFALCAMRLDPCRHPAGDRRLEVGRLQLWVHDRPGLLRRLGHFHDHLELVGVRHVRLADNHCACLGGGGRCSRSSTGLAVHPRKSRDLWRVLGLRTRRERSGAAVVYLGPCSQKLPQQSKPLILARDRRPRLATRDMRN